MPSAASVRAFAIAQEVAIKHSDVIISNTYTYTDDGESPYETPPFNEKATLQKMEGLYNVFAGIAGKYSQTGDHESNNLYQIELGRAMTKKRVIPQQAEIDWPPSKGMIRYGKCYLCAALVAHELLSSKDFRDLGLAVEIGKTSGVKHYFTVVGRGTGGFNSVATWGGDAFIVDIWHANFNQTKPLEKRARDEQHGCPAVVLPNDWAYIEDAASGLMSVVNRFDPPFTDEVKKLAELDG